MENKLIENKEITLEQLANTNITNVLASNTEIGKQLKLNVYIGNAGDTYVTFGVYVNDKYINSGTTLKEMLVLYNQIGKE